MGQRMTTKEIRQIYFSEVKHNIFKRTTKTIFVLILSVLSIFLADAATNQDLNTNKPNFRR